MGKYINHMVADTKQTSNMPSHANEAMVDQTDMACWILKYSDTNQHQNKGRNRLHDSKEPQNSTPCKGMIIVDHSLQHLAKHNILRIH